MADQTLGICRVLGGYRSHMDNTPDPRSCRPRLLPSAMYESMVLLQLVFLMISVAWVSTAVLY